MSIGLPSFQVSTLINYIRQNISESNSDTITDEQIMSDMNWVWQFDIPQGNTEFGLQDDWTFMTVAGIDTYVFPQGQILSVQDNTICIDMVPMGISRAESKRRFYLSVGNRSNTLIFEGEQANAGPYTYVIGGGIARGYISNLGVYESQVNISWTDSNGNGYNLLDNGDGNLYYATYAVNAGGYTIPTYTKYGTVVYATGTVNFTLPVEATGNIYLNYDNTGWGKPFSAVFVDNMVILRAVPNQPYRMSVLVQYIPNPFTAVTDTLPLLVYAQQLIIGTSLRIAKRNNDQLQVTFLQEQYNTVSAMASNVNTKNKTPIRRETQYNHSGGYGQSIGIFPNPFGFGGSSLI